MRLRPAVVAVINCDSVAESVAEEEQPLKKTKALTIESNMRLITPQVCEFADPHVLNNYWCCEGVIEFVFYISLLN